MTRAQPPAPYPDLEVPDSCGGYAFTRGAKPFAAGHGGRILVFLAQGVTDGRMLIWKEDPLAGESKECEMNERLRKAGVNGPGCAAACERGILLDAVLQPGTGRQVAPTLSDWLEKFPEAESGRFNTSLRQLTRAYLIQVEGMMLAGVLDTDRHSNNVLVPAADAAALIDFAPRDGELKDFGSWENISCLSKVSFFGASIGMAFCSSSHDTKECDAVQEYFEAVLSGEDESLVGAFQRPETPELVDDAFRLFLSRGFSSENLNNIRFDMDPSTVIVSYSFDSKHIPSQEFVLERSEKGDSTLVTAVRGQDESGQPTKAAFYGVRPGCRLVQVVRFRHNMVPERVPMSLPLGQLDKTYEEGPVFFFFEPAEIQVVYEGGFQDFGFLPSLEFQLSRGPQDSLVVHQMSSCLASGRPSRAALAGVRPGWRLVGATQRALQLPPPPVNGAPGGGDDGGGDDGDGDDGGNAEEDKFLELPVPLDGAPDLTRLDSLIANSGITLSLVFRAPWLLHLPALAAAAQPLQTAQTADIAAAVAVADVVV